MYEKYSTTWLPKKKKVIKASTKQVNNETQCNLTQNEMNYSEENNLQPNSSFEKLFPFLFSNENSLSSKSEETGEQSLTTHELKRKFDQLRNKPSNLPGIKKVKQLQMTYE